MLNPKNLVRFFMFCTVIVQSGTMIYGMDTFTKFHEKLSWAQKHLSRAWNYTCPDADMKARVCVWMGLGASTYLSYKAFEKCCNDTAFSMAAYSALTLGGLSCLLGGMAYRDFQHWKLLHGLEQHNNNSLKRDAIKFTSVAAYLISRLPETPASSEAGEYKITNGLSFEGIYANVSGLTSGSVHTKTTIKKGKNTDTIEKKSHDIDQRIREVTGQITKEMGALKNTIDFLSPYAYALSEIPLVNGTIFEAPFQNTFNISTIPYQKHNPSLSFNNFVRLNNSWNPLKWRCMPNQHKASCIQESTFNQYACLAQLSQKIDQMD